MKNQEGHKHIEQVTVIVVLPFAIIFEDVFSYWRKGMVKFITKGEGNMQRVELWDVTEASNPRNDESAYVEMMMPSEDYALVCADLFTNHGLSVGDEIGLY
ncbi:hypothetical protein R3W88_032132 [Solanum pinnatisectum]|uniref:Uncharacterized protein n=1 Tax=Solanum pinnatisectum TaxID=50273 RepID=A0AAV9LQY1_9SOLN|nr:hypothetical protein R3W88_032132 [Solanum pinnatisectum]